MARAPQADGGEVPVQPLVAEAFGKALGTWYRRHARKLPWRGVRNPYATWLSEIMLQQTRVATVIDRYGEFLRRFPTLRDLAEAPEDDVLALWSGLGYYRRARMLHRGAQFVVRELGGELPGNATELRTLPGVGEYTAAAIASIAFGESVAVLDGNVERVLLRILGQAEEKTAAARAVLLRTANELVPPAAARRGGTRNPPGDHNQAMMELGATICLPRAPLCLQCPVMAFCQTRGAHATAARTPLRSRHVACLLATRKQGVTTEVLLERRSPEASLMAGMLELPPLPMTAVEGREPVLRLRHSITNTNYYVEIYTEGGGAPGPPEDTGQQPFLYASMRWARVEDVPAREAADEEEDEDERVFQADPGSSGGGEHRLLREVVAAPEDLRWCPTHRLYDQPLTGLARKTLQRLGLMRMSPVKVHSGAGSV